MQENYRQIFEDAFHLNLLPSPANDFFSRLRFHGCWNREIKQEKYLPEFIENHVYTSLHTNRKKTSMLLKKFQASNPFKDYWLEHQRPNFKKKNCFGKPSCDEITFVFTSNIDIQCLINVKIHWCNLCFRELWQLHVELKWQEHI